MNPTYQNAMIGSLVADAVSMPVHWYYNTNTLDKDYGRLDGYVAPKNPHADSILWRSKYSPRNKRGDILHDQAKYWGQRGVHYHQFLAAGENTINYRLGAELYRQIVDAGVYDAEAWLELYVERMLTKGWHKDTYVEEYHRAFFENYAKGKSLSQCGINDLHIGGLSQVPSLLAALDVIGTTALDAQLQIVTQHVQLTHQNKHVVQSAQAMTEMIYSIAEGSNLRATLSEYAGSWARQGQFDTWSSFEDRTVVGRHLSTACYLPESFTASLYFCWKYDEAFSDGILANAHCGGDNCHRGAVVGALLGAANGVSSRWLNELKAMTVVSPEKPPHGAGSFHDPEQHAKLMDRVDAMLKNEA